MVVITATIDNEGNYHNYNSDYDNENVAHFIVIVIKKIR